MALTVRIRSLLAVIKSKMFFIMNVYNDVLVRRLEQPALPLRKRHLKRYVIEMVCGYSFAGGMKISSKRAKNSIMVCSQFRLSICCA